MKFRSCPIENRTLRSLALLLVALLGTVLFSKPLLAAPDAPDATLLAHFDAANIDGTGTQTGDICSRTDTTWVNLAGNGDGTLTNFPLPCTTDEGWKGNGSIANPYRLHFDGGVWAGDRVAFSLDSPQSVNLWFYDDDTGIFPGYADTVFSHGVNSANGSYIGLQNARLGMAYNGGATGRTGFSTDDWHMLTMVNDGSTTTYYLDNVEFAGESGSSSVTSTTASLGVNNTLQRGFNGSIASFQAYSDALTRAQVTELYQQERYRFEPDPGVLHIERIQDAFDGTAGGKTVTIYGQHFEAPITAVTFDGLAGTNITLLDQGRISVQTPAHMVGYVDVTVSSASSGSDTRPEAFYYTETPVDNLQLWFDAGNNDAAGDKGYASTTNLWANLLYGSDGGLMKIDLPATADEGWKGSGPADPYRLQLDGSGSLAAADAVAFYMDTPRSINAWFIIDELPEAQGSVLQPTTGDLAAIWVLSSGNLVFNYNGESVYAAQPVTLNEWHMATIFNDGATTYYYLDNELVTTEANTPSTDAAWAALGGQDGGMEKGFNGSICDFRVYDDALTVAEIDTLFHEKRNCYAPSRPVSVGSLVWHDLDGDGQQDVGEPGIAGATARLLDGNGDPVHDADGLLVADQVTTGSGTFSFTNLLPGDYMVEVTPPSGLGYLSTTTPADPDPDNNPSNSDSNGVDGCELGNITPVIIDDGDAEFSQSGFAPITGQGYLGDLHYTSGNSSGDVATWTFSDLAPAQYRVMATWEEGNTRATDAPYTIRDTVIDVNQKIAPNDLFDVGVYWEELGVFTVTDGNLVVELSDDADNYVIADAIRLSQGVIECNGVLRSPLFTLTTGDLPVDEQFANGADDQDGDPDIDGNMTVDFGFTTRDYGDAPDDADGTHTGDYNTTEADNGPYHTIADDLLYLGSVTPDADDGTLQGGDADADDDSSSTNDEDGIATLPAITTTSTSVDMTVRATNNSGSLATLACWIDFQRDGTFSNVGDRQATADNAVGPGTQDYTLTFTGFGTPVIGVSYIRCRLAYLPEEVAESTGAASSGEIEDFKAEILDNTLPVNLSYFYSEQAADGTVHFTWETATETGNAGFNLYMEIDGGQSLVTPEMIPSSVIDSVTPTRYTYAANVAGQRFYLEMIDISGKSERYGPFVLGVAFGSTGAINTPGGDELTNPLYLPIVRGR